ncbi:MAG: chemotaxis protein CheW [Desulfamplus sp.]|nr:chemotaxis protein CheW [Desulfamplus sp.]
MPDKKILESILEDISLECVLADISDPESFSELFSLLKIFFQKAKDCNFPELAEDAKKAGKIVKTIMAQNSSDNIYSYKPDNVSDIENQIDSINLIVSEMKSFLHFITLSSDQDETEAVSYSEPIQNGQYESAAEVSRKFYVDEQTDSKSDIKTSLTSEIRPALVSEFKTDVKNADLNLLHPGQLPAFLNIEDFAEFLSLQKNTLEKMEVLILDIEKNNNRAYAQGELKRLFHTTKGEAGFLGLRDVENLCHRAEDLMDTEHFGNIVDILLAVKDWLETTYSVYAGSTGTLPSLDRLIELFDRDKQRKTDEIQEVPILSEPNDVTSDITPNTTKPDEETLLVTVNSSPPILTESINVDAVRLDRMVNIIGELAIAESMVTQSTEIREIASSTLLRALSSLHKITRELQTLGLSLRMIPLKSLFNRMDRVVRDLAKKTGKKIQFTIKGESTELDKTLVDKLGDPLIHILRNSVDHGIEDDILNRVNLGKPETATIELRAFHKGGYLFIEVEDDGKGINRKLLAEKAISQGIIKSTTHQGNITDTNLYNTAFSSIDKTYSDEILNLVFHPGLTTAAKVTDVSGRGVGMDVVRKSIESCRGKVSISSIEGKGTTCTIKIPLTLSIIDGLVVRVAKEIYVIPTLSVVTSLKVDKQEISNVFEKGEMINVLGRLIPLFRLNRLFKIKDPAQDTCNGIIVVIEDNGLNTALLVDELIGKQNTVIKNLGMGIGMGMDDEIKGISGGTIMPDGRVSLILDIAGIIELSHSS